MAQAGQLKKNVQVSTPVKIGANQVEDSHAAQAAAVGGAKDEAKIDLAALMTATDAMQRDQAAIELANLVKARFFNGSPSPQS
jgi:hypothetical protein